MKIWGSEGGRGGGEPDNHLIFFEDVIYKQFLRKLR